MAMRILVVGAYGQLGSELREILESGMAEIGPIPWQYASSEVDYVDNDQLDITDQTAVMEWFAQHDYDLVINCAAYTNVDGCEENPDLAFAVNATGAQNLALASAKQNAALVSVSTDYVFPGTDPHPRVETDPTGPISTYGRSKLLGEEQAQEANPRTYIVRTAWLYGALGHNFVRTMLRLGSERDEVTVVDDQFGNPTSANDLAYEILKIALTDDYGIFHVTGEGTCSWADFAQAIMEGAQLPCRVKRCTSEEYKAMNPKSASRPAYSSLENRRLADTIGDEIRPWPQALKSYLERLEEV